MIAVAIKMREDIELALEKLRQDKEKLMTVKEILLIKRQYDNQTEKVIEDVFNNHKSKL